MTWYRPNAGFCVDTIQGYYYRLNEDNKFCLLRKQMTSRLRLISGAGDTPERRENLSVETEKIDWRLLYVIFCSVNSLSIIKLERKIFFI